MKGTRSQWLHVGASALSIVGFFVLMSYFQLFDTKIEYTNPSYVIRSALAFSCMPLALYFILAPFAGRKLAIVIAAGMFSLLALAFVIGAMGWHIPLLSWLFGAYILYALYGGLSSGEFEVNRRIITRTNNTFHYWFTVALCTAILLFIAYQTYLAMR